MKLRDYLQREKISVAEFGRRVGVRNRMTMLRYINHQRPVPHTVVLAIVRETAGEVTPNDFFDIGSGEAA